MTPRSDVVLKRCFDIVASLGGLILLTPLFAVVALLIRLDSPGPILFRQPRVGRGFTIFTILKFRTMVADASNRGGTLTAGADPRITRVGAVLRLLKIDELPQLINVLRGDMSLVGPRPEVPRYVEMFRADYREILTARPGITDLSSLKYRNEAAILGRVPRPEEYYVSTILPDKIQLAKEYLRHTSLAFDVRVILRTLMSLFAGHIPLGVRHRASKKGEIVARRSVVLFRVVCVVLTATLAEAGSAVMSAYLARRSMMASIPDFTDEQVSYYVSRHHPMLGWGPAFDDQARVVRLEPRFDPAYPAVAGWSFTGIGDERVMNETVGADPGTPPCVSTYGDSFTAGSEVDDNKTYPHVLGVKLGCRAANYGVPGFGTDQALMLFRAQREKDAAPLVILGHISEDLLRNVNQYRNLLDPGNHSALVFKPLFTLFDGGLRFQPIPVQTDADVRAFRQRPDSFLQHDAFRSRPRREFPYSLSLIRWALTDFHVRARLAELPRFVTFYDPTHPSGAFALTAAIMRAFSDEARATGREAVVVLVSAGRDFAHYRKTGRWINEELGEVLERAGVRVIRTGPQMVARLGSDDPCILFRNCFQHFNARGYELLASVIADYVRTQTAVHTRSVRGNSS
jgi:lipopolysaccharide/colanic/teichoic acid biosynthesis glycosyltransferase